MKNVMRVGVLILVLTMITLSIVGCGNDNSDVGNGIQEVRVWTSNSHSYEIMTDLVNNFNETEGKKLGIEINYELQSNDAYSSSLELAFQAGTAPDLYNLTNLPQLVDGGNALPLEELPNMQETIDSLRGYLKAGINIAADGKVYSLAGGVTTRGLVYNKEMFKAAGIVDENGEAKPPVTYKELREYAKKLTDPSKKQYGIIFPMKWSGWFDSDVLDPSMASTGTCGYNPVTGEYDYSAMEPVLQTFIDIGKDGSYMPGAETIDNDQARARFAEGQIGMKFAHSFDVSVYNEQFKAEFDWGVAPLPVVDENDRYYQPMQIGASMMVNPNSSVDREKLAAVVKFFVSEEVNKRCYEEGLAIPYDSKIVENTEIKDGKKGWAEFAEMVEISKVTPATMPVDRGTDTKLADNFINKVWAGEMTPKEALKYETDSRNKGIKTYKDAHPEFDSSTRIMEEWDARLK